MQTLRAKAIFGAILIVLMTAAIVSGGGFADDFEDGAIGAFPDSPWLPVATRVVGSDAATPSTAIISTTGPDGNVTRAAQIVDAFSDSAGTLVEVVPADKMRFVADFRLDRFGDSTQGIRWSGIGFFQDGPADNLNGNPQLVVYVYNGDPRFLVFFNNGAGGSGGIGLSSPLVTPGVWYRIELEVDTISGVTDIEVFVSSTGALFAAYSGSIPANWDPSSGRYDALVLLKGEDFASSGSFGTQTTIDNVEFFGDNAPKLPVWPHYIEKSRYVSFDPNNAFDSLAIAIELPDGRTGWVGEPVSLAWNGSDASSVSHVVDAPVFRVWSEAVVHVTGCVVAPGETYELSATSDGVSFTSPLVVRTVPDPLVGSWADIVGSFDTPSQSWGPPNGFVNFNDIDAAVKKFQISPTGAHLTVVDLHPQWPNFIINFSDIDMVIKGFQNALYPVPVADCEAVANCPLGAVSACLP